MEARRDRVRRRTLLLLARAVQTLEQAGVEWPGLDADVLFTAAIGIDRSKLYTGSFSLNDRAIQRWRKFVARRAAREPLAYIAGCKEFYGLEFEVNPAVLIPRPETEIVVEAALNALAGKQDVGVLDFGTGSGAIAIAIAIAVQSAAAKLTAIDISAAALEVARRNADRHGCVQRIEFLLGDGFA
ncbi:MAG TPA: HemK family protein methyltransferase, partial [Candidatus Binataceae bacterium]